MITLFMKKYSMILREAAKILALSSEKIEKYEHLTGEKILPSDQSRVIERGKFTYYWLRKSFVKQKKIEEQGNNKLKL